MYTALARTPETLLRQRSTVDSDTPTTMVVQTSQTPDGIWRARVRAAWPAAARDRVDAARRAIESRLVDDNQIVRAMTLELEPLAVGDPDEITYGEKH